ncbi:MAG: hypothetical protein JJE12_11545, partial [Anaerolineales bacterium]|nr:hypothetical protein [Anaerolineales bacterium]
MSQVARKVLIGILVVILAVSVLLVILIPYNITRSFPQTEGQIQVPGLDAPVEVHR